MSLEYGGKHLQSTASIYGGWVMMTSTLLAITSLADFEVTTYAVFGQPDALNSIAVMSQFQGGHFVGDKEKVFAEKRGYNVVGGRTIIQYPSCTKMIRLWLLT